MEAVLSNQYVSWIIMGVVSGLLALVIGLIKRQQARDEKRVDALEKRVDEEREKLNATIADLPRYYTLRDDFLRVTSAQTNKLDKITDMIGDLGKSVSALGARERRSSDGNQ